MIYTQLLQEQQFSSYLHVEYIEPNNVANFGILCDMQALKIMKFFLVNTLETLEKG